MAAGINDTYRWSWPNYSPSEEAADLGSSSTVHLAGFAASQSHGSGCLDREQQGMVPVATIKDHRLNSYYCAPLAYLYCITASDRPAQ